MRPVPGIRRSVLAHGIAFLVLQEAIIAALTFGYGMELPRAALFAAVALAYHALLTGVLLARWEDFRTEPAGLRLERVNLANTLSFGRLSSIPTILYMVMQAPAYRVLPVTLPFVCVVFATDFVDGMVARRRGEITFVGRYLDSSSDYVTIIAMSILFYINGLIPLWFFILVLARLVLFALGMAVLALREGKANPLATFLGKVSIFALMVLYLAEIAGVFGVPWIGNPTVVSILEYVVAAVVVVSMGDKVVFLWGRFAEVAVGRGKRRENTGS
ncbi:MAG TPA: CDP-alcohol phosphatidyltransferase family protein [Spirochaetia bacterium]|nr:CDP-alcohol phosphatidyltransferase family protein [Spirochaetia bacterium]